MTWSVLSTLQVLMYSATNEIWTLYTWGPGTGKLKLAQGHTPKGFHLNVPFQRICWTHFLQLFKQVARMLGVFPLRFFCYLLNLYLRLISHALELASSLCLYHRKCLASRAQASCREWLLFLYQCECKCRLTFWLTSFCFNPCRFFLCSVGT